MYLFALPVLLHHWAAISIPSAFFIFVFFLLNAGIFIAWKVLRRHPLFSTRASQMLFVTAMYCACFLLPSFNGEFGQREHIFCALCLPYFCLHLCHYFQAPVDRRWTWAAGLLGAIGFCIKPNFFPVWVVAESSLFFLRPSEITILRPESLVIALASLGYYVLIFLSLPDYWQVTLPASMESFTAYYSPWSLLLQNGLSSYLPAAMMLYAAWGTSFRNVFIAFNAIALAMVFSYLASHCDYHYHLLPLLWLEILMSALLALIFASPRSGYVILGFFIFISMASMHGMNRDKILEITEGIRRHAEGKSAVFLSTSVAGAFPSVLYANAEWGTGIPHLMQVTAPYQHYRGTHQEPAYHDTGSMTFSESVFNNLLIKDLERKPTLIAIDDCILKQGLEGIKFNILNYFNKQDRFREVWRHYHFAERVDCYNFYLINDK